MQQASPKKPKVCGPKHRALSAPPALGACLVFRQAWCSPRPLPTLFSPSRPTARTHFKHALIVFFCFVCVCVLFSQKPVTAVKIVLGFVLKMAVYWPWLARDLFFCPSLEQAALRR